jgi:3-oxoacyl-[acyl-carrier-protein] synthase-3
MMMETSVLMSLVDLEEVMPAKVIGNDYFGEEEIRLKNRMFSGTKERRHMERDELASDYFTVAANSLLKRLGLKADEDVDMILTNVSVPDECFTGCGAVVNKKIFGKAKWIFDLHNSGCVSFLYLLEMAQTYMQVHQARHALICIGQTSGGRVFGQEDTKQFAQAAIPGDGFAVAYVRRSDEHPLLAMTFKNYPQYSEDMFCDCNGRKWWESRSSSGKIDFNEDKTAMIVARGNKAVPTMIREVCKKANVQPKDIDVLITNQPNRMFLRNWREAVELSPEKHFDTFEKYANLFGAGIPVTLSEAIKEKRIKTGDLVCLAGFSHACDYAGAVLLRW